MRIDNCLTQCIRFNLELVEIADVVLSQVKLALADIASMLAL